MALIIVSYIILALIDLVCVYEMSKQLATEQSKKWIAPTFAILYVCVFVVSNIFVSNLVLLMIIHYLMLSICTFMYRITIFKRIFAIVTFISVSLIAYFLVEFFLSVAIGDGAISSGSSIINSVLASITVKFAVYTNIRLFFNLFLRNAPAKTKKVNLLNIIMPCATLFTIFIITVMTHYSATSSVGILAICVSFLLIIANISSFIIYENNVSAEIKAEQERYEKLMYMESEKVLTKLISGQIKANKEIHEFKNQIYTLREMLSCNSSEALDFVNNMCDIYKNKELIAYTTVQEVDILLNSKMHIAKELDIEMQYIIIIASINWINSLDLNMILGNLLDNAIENTTDKLIRLTIKSHGNYLAIKCENGVKESAINTAQSSKENATLLHGYGLKRITEIAEKYNGSFAKVIINNNFIASVLLMNPD